MSTEAQIYGQKMRSLILTHTTELIGYQSPDQFTYEIKIGLLLARGAIPFADPSIEEREYAAFAAAAAREHLLRKQENEQKSDRICQSIAGLELYQIDAVAVAQTFANEENILSLHRANRYRELMGSFSPAAQQAIMTYIDTELVPGTVGYTFDFEGMAAQDPAAIAETIHFGCEHRDQLKSFHSGTLELGQPISR